MVFRVSCVCWCVCVCVTVCVRAGMVPTLKKLKNSPVRKTETQHMATDTKVGGNNQDTARNLRFAFRFLLMGTHCALVWCACVRCAFGGMCMGVPVCACAFLIQSLRKRGREHFLTRPTVTNMRCSHPGFLQKEAPSQLTCARTPRPSLTHRVLYTQRTGLSFLVDLFARARSRSSQDSFRKARTHARTHARTRISRTSRARAS